MFKAMGGTFKELWVITSFRMLLNYLETKNALKKIHVRQYKCHMFEILLLRYKG